MASDRDQWFEDAKTADIVQVAGSLGIRLKKAGRDLHASCPVCGGKDGNEFILTPGNKPNEQFLCRKSGVGGGVVTMVMHCESIPDTKEGYVEACEKIMGGPPPGSKATELTDEQRQERDRIRDQRAAEVRAAEAERDRQEQQRKTGEREKALAIWESTLPLHGTYGWEYLKARHAEPATPSMAKDLRFIAEHPFWVHDEAENKWREVGKFPCMVAAIRNRAGDVVGIHQTYLDPEQPGKKLETPRGSKAKKIRGEQVGGGISLGKPTTSIATGEGIETVGAWHKLNVGPDDISLETAVSIGNLAGGATGTVPHPRERQVLRQTGRRPAPVSNGIPDMGKPGWLPPEGVKEVYILGDGDSEWVWTIAKILTAGRRLRNLGYKVFVHMAPDGMDWNDFRIAQLADSGLEVPPIQSFEDFEAMAEREIRSTSRFGRLPWNRLDEPGVEHSYIVDRLLSRGDKSIIGGPSQSGKSFFAIHLGMCIARGIRFFGHDCEKSLVVYQAGEGARGIKKRLRAYRNHFAVPSSEDVPFELLTSQVDLYAKDGDTKPLIDELKQIMADWPEMRDVVFFIDTLATATAGADENSGKDMGAVMKNIDLIARATGAHVCLVHHMNAGGTKLRGHTSIYANIDQVILVTRDEQTEIRTAKLDKQKDDEAGLSIRFELKSIEIARDDKNRPVTSCVCLNVGEKEELAKSEISGLWTPNVQERNVINIVLSALDKYGRPPTAQERRDANLPDVVREVVDWDAYRETARALSPGEDERNADAIRKEFGRVLDKIGPKAARVIGYHRPLIWMTGRPVKGFPSTYPKTGQNPDRTRTDGGLPGQDERLEEVAKELQDAGF